MCNNCDVLRATVEELRSELAAWKDYQQPRARHAFDLDRVAAAKRALRTDLYPAKVLTLLIDRAGQMVSADDIVEIVVGKDPLDCDTNLGIVHVSHLRTAIRESGLGSPIKTIRRLGYTISPEDAQTVASWIEGARH